MSDDTHELDDWVRHLISTLSPEQRRALARSIATTMRQRSRARISAQQNPDGKPFEKRKPQPKLRGQKGKLRSKMFTKLRTTKFLKVDSTPDSAVVFFANHVQRIAQVHQYGLRDRVTKDGPTVRYAARELLGITDHDQDAIADMVLAHVTR